MCATNSWITAVNNATKTECYMKQNGAMQLCECVFSLLMPKNKGNPD